MLVTNCTCSLGRFFPWHFLVLPTNFNDKGLNLILAVGFFCPLMQTLFALSSMFLGCRFCKHSTLVNWTYWTFNKPSLSVWSLLQKNCRMSHTASKPGLQEQLCQSCCPMSLSHIIFTLYSCFSILQLQQTWYSANKHTYHMQGQINSFADLILIQKSQLWFTTYSIHLKKQDWQANANMQCWWCTLLDN